MAIRRCANIVFMDTLATKLASARTAKGLSYEGLGKMYGGCQSTIASIESGRNRSSTFLPKLAQLPGVGALWVANGDESVTGDALTIHVRARRKSFLSRTR